jgi:hypothetical protein
VGGVVVLAVALCLFCYWRRRHRLNSSVAIRDEIDGTAAESTSFDVMSPNEPFMRSTPFTYGSSAWSGYPSEPSTPYREAGSPVLSPPAASATASSDLSPGLEAREKPSSDSKAALRLARQRELEGQMEAIRQDLADSMAGQSSAGVGTQESETQNQIRAMQEQIRELQRRQQTPWAQGLTDEPPPGYSPDV